MLCLLRGIFHNWKAQYADDMLILEEIAAIIENMGTEARLNWEFNPAARHVLALAGASFPYDGSCPTPSVEELKTVRPVLLPYMPREIEEGIYSAPLAEARKKRMASGCPGRTAHPR